MRSFKVTRCSSVGKPSTNFNQMKLNLVLSVLDVSVSVSSLYSLQLDEPFSLFPVLQLVARAVLSFNYFWKGAYDTVVPYRKCDLVEEFLH